MIESCENKFLLISLYLYVVMLLVPLLAKWHKLNRGYNSSGNYVMFRKLRSRVNHDSRFQIFSQILHKSNIYILISRLRYLISSLYY